MSSERKAGVAIVVAPSGSAWSSALKKRPMLIIVPIVVIIAAYFILLRPPKPEAPTRAAVGTGATYGASQGELNPRQVDLIDQHNDADAARAGEAMDAGKPAANVANVYTGDVSADYDTPPPPPPPNLTEPRQPSSRASSRAAAPRQPDRSITQYTDRMYARWGATANAATYSTADPTPAAAIGASDSETDIAASLGLPIGVPINAILRVGANSDAPGAVIAEITRPPMRLIGEAKRTAPDQVVVTFSSAITRDGTLYQLDAQALDPETGSPALQGNVKRHILRNLFGSVTGTTVAYLGGFSRGVRSNPNSILGFGFDPSLALRATAAETVQSTIPPPRPPTVTIDAGTPIQVLIVSRPRADTRNPQTPQPSSAVPESDAPVVLDAYTTQPNQANTPNYGYQ